MPGDRQAASPRVLRRPLARLPRQIRQNLTATPAGDTPDEVLAWVRRAIAEADAAAERQAQAEAAQETLW